MRIKSLFIFLLIGLFMISFSSALIKDYDKQEKEVSIYGGTIIKGDLLGTIKLLTPLNNKVGYGKEVKVFEFEITNYADRDFDNIFKKISTYTALDLKEISRNVKLKYRTTAIINNTETALVCSGSNETQNYNCEEEITGYRIEQIYQYHDITTNTLRKGQKVYVSGWTYVEKGDFVEWIPTFKFGTEEKDVEEWATWSSSLETDLIVWYPLNESSGSALDYVGDADLTAGGTPDYSQNGLAENTGSSIRLAQSSNEYFSNASIVLGNQDQTYSVGGWFETGTIVGDLQALVTAGDNTGQPQPFNCQTGGWYDDELACEIGNSASKTRLDSVSVLADNSVYFFVLTLDGTNMTIWINGSAEASTTLTETHTWTDGFNIGRKNEGSNYMWEGKVDEIFFYDRVLSETEIADLYNGNGTGVGLTPFIGAGSEININTLTPINETSTGNPSQDFVCNVSTTANDIENVSLVFNDSITSTNTSGINGTNYTFSYSIPIAGSYEWYCESYDNESTQYTSEVFHIEYINDLTASLKAPANAYNTPNDTTYVTGYASDDTSINNVSLIWWKKSGAIYQSQTPVTNTSGINNSNYTFTIDTTNDGAWRWTIKACDANVCSQPSEWDLVKDTTAPTINITLPLNSQTYGQSGTIEELNYTTEDLSSMDECWYEYNNTNTSLSSCENTTFTITPNHNVKVWGNDTYGNLGYDELNWEYTLFLNSIDYNAEAYETGRETIGLNLSYDTGDLAVTAVLEYDETNYSTTKSVESYGAYFIKTFDIPIIDDGNETQIKNFSFHFNTTGSLESTDATDQANQTINAIYLGGCNVNQTIYGVNFTYYDEDTGTEINGTTNATDLEATFNYWVGTGNTYKNYSIAIYNSTNTTYSFCIYPSNDTTNKIKTDLDMVFNADGYLENTHYLRNATLTNDTNVIPLYLLSQDLGQKFFFTTYYGVSPLTQTIIQISKYFEGEGVSKSVGIGKTDSSGKFTKYLDLDKDYTFTAIKDGTNYGSQSKTAICLSAPCEMTLQYTESDGSLLSGYYDEFAESVTYSLDYNNSNSMVSATFTDLTGTANYFRLVVQRTSLNETSLTACDETLYATAGTLYCNMSGYTGNYQAQLSVSRSPEKIIDIIGFVIGSLAESLGFTGLLVSFVLLLIIIFAGLVNPVIAIAGIPVGLTTLKLLGFLPISWLFIGGITALAIWLIGRIKA